MSLIKKSSEGKNSFGKNSFDNVLGSSQSIKDVITLASRVSESDIPVLLQGESGSGKELVAHTIHNSSKRCDKQFVAVNCGAIPENLVESILFGHEKGAFTGAFYKTFGKFREADGGTIFLDEINELSKDFQVKLLRLLQHGEIEPVGANKPMKVNVRVISATSCDLSKEVAEGRFREDLYYRISVFPIKIPSLRSRKQDIPFLINYFIKNFCQSENKKIDSISKEAEKFLCDYRWPGNIRQLKNAIFRAVVMCDSDRLTINDFLHLNPVANTESDDILNSPRASKMIVNTNIFFDQVGKDMRSLSDIEKDIITTALEYYNGHISKISKKLGIGRSTLYRKMLEYNIPHNKNL
jgi:transcriptional regulator with PAS, ATPase and Fis domain